MTSWVLKALIVLALPLVVFVCVGQLQLRLSQRHLAEDQWRKAGIRQPLNLRLGGYRKADAVAFFSALGQGEKGPRALDAERAFLRYDLAFPLFYGGALVTSLLIGWAWLGRPPSALWLAPTALGVIADWVENLIHLRELAAFRDGGAEALSARAIQLASAATQAKFLALIAAFLGVMLLATLLARLAWAQD